MACLQCADARDEPLHFLLETILHSMCKFHLFQQMNEFVDGVAIETLLKKLQHSFDNYMCLLIELFDSI